MTMLLELVYAIVLNLILLELPFYFPHDIKISYFEDVLPSQSLGLVLKNENKYSKRKHASVTKYHTT